MEQQPLWDAISRLERRIDELHIHMRNLSRELREGAADDYEQLSTRLMRVEDDIRNLKAAC